MSEHTKGEWMLPHLATDGGCNCGYVLNGGYCGAIATVHWSKDRSIEEGDNPPLKEAQANAKLIAEAGNVTNETGYTPRQLAEQKAELLAVLNRIMLIESRAFELKGFDVKRFKSDINQAIQNATK